MSRIITFMEGSNLRPVRLRERIDGQQLGIEGRAIAEAASYAAQEIRSKLIVVFTKSGSMARHLAALRPTQRIVAFTPHETTYRALAAVWGIEPCLLDFTGRTFDLLARADEVLVSRQLSRRGETVVAMAGRLPEQPSLSSMMKLHRIGEMKTMDG
jgi:pyruvate kinase